MLLAKGADKDTVELYGVNPLHFNKGYKEIVKMLLAVCDKNRADHVGRTPLHTAV